MASTVIRNIGFEIQSLTGSFSHLSLEPGGAITVALAKATVLSYLGGVDEVKGKFSLSEKDGTEGLTGYQATAVTRLTIGDPTTGYITPNDTWLYGDGVHPVTIPALCFIDTVTGLPKTVTVTSGALVVS
jgi:hypothetical protein